MVPELHEREEGVVHLSVASILVTCYLLCVSQDECSFVSLRDVERAMIVFKFFTEKFKMKLFTEHIARKAAAEVSDVRTQPAFIQKIFKGGARNHDNK